MTLFSAHYGNELLTLSALELIQQSVEIQSRTDPKRTDCGHTILLRTTSGQIRAENRAAPRINYSIGLLSL
jgi:hypothetical protein